MEKTSFGNINGRKFSLYTLSNSHGMSVSITELGAIITSIKIPVAGKIRECVLGFDNINDYYSDEYQAGYPYLGAVIGRNAGRVSGSQFPLNGKIISLTANQGAIHLHGGKEGFDRKIWSVENIDNQKITLSYFSKDGEEGYLGNATIKVTYELNHDNELKVSYFAETDQPTLLNLTQHSYFNLNEEITGDILSHKIQIEAEKYVPLNDALLPLGEIHSVKKTDLDYQNPKNPDKNLDNSFVLPENNTIAGTLESPDGKLKMEVYTSQPILHIYTGYYLPELTPENRKRIGKNSGICFETQGFSDAPNHSEFQSTILNPEDIYEKSTIFKFIF